jgi:hypothetical protein
VNVLLSFLDNHLGSLASIDFFAALTHDIPDFSACKCNTREIAKDSTWAMVAGGPG